MADVKGVLSELRRRKVIHTAVVYTALAWAALEHEALLEQTTS